MDFSGHIYAFHRQVSSVQLKPHERQWNIGEKHIDPSNYIIRNSWGDDSGNNMINIINVASKSSATSSDI